MCKVDIPIFVIARGEDVQTEHCTIELLPFTYAFLKRNQVVNKCYIVSSSERVLDFAKRLGFVHTHHFNGHDENLNYLNHSCLNYLNHNCLNYIEFLGPQDCTITHKMEWEWCIVLQVNQVFYDPDLLLNVITKINEKYDFITSYNVIWDTNEYLLNDNLQLQNQQQIEDLSTYKQMHRKPILDNAIFCLKNEFAKKCCESKNPRNILWSGKKLLVYNDVEYHPVYDNNDILNIHMANYIFSKTNEIKEDMNIENNNIISTYYKLLLSKKKLYNRI